ncbi:K02A2.6-like [Cordylochernes scorpioides]|uniref:K02A2.6-like n=1 Tax=Cordylochernes scorpioides TaxID=51811 RepID=A0ABY6KYW1_9ARAC|nr:K02A2.6-like [Cordylochernes scorpioides]
MGLKLGLTSPIITEALTEGLCHQDQLLMRAVAPISLTEWYATLTRIRDVSSMAAQAEPPRRAPSDHDTPYGPKTPLGVETTSGTPLIVPRDTKRVSENHHSRTAFSATKLSRPKSKAELSARNSRRGRLQVTLAGPYRASLADQHEIQDQIREMLKYNIIEPSFSPYSSTVTLVTKKDKSKRFCVDYRRLNEIISPTYALFPS